MTRAKKQTLLGGVVDIVKLPAGKDLPDPVSMIEADQDKVKKLLSKYKKAKTSTAKKTVVKQMISELELPAAINDKLIHPTMETIVDKMVSLFTACQGQTVIDQLSNVNGQDETATKPVRRKARKVAKAS